MVSETDTILTIAMLFFSRMCEICLHKVRNPYTVTGSITDMYSFMMNPVDHYEC